MARNPKAESNIMTSVLRDFKQPNTGELTPNNRPAGGATTPAPTEAPQPEGITLTQEALGGNIVEGDSFVVRTVNSDGTIVLFKQQPPTV